MDSEKVGNFIKEIRKKNGLTQKDLADKYGVTYQAVSKWERGLNLPDVALIKMMSDDFNISIEEILNGKEVPKKKHKNIIILLIIILMIMISIIIILFIKANYSFKFKTLDTACPEFKISGSIAYDKNKSSIYISDISYCGESDDTKYKEIECNLYEQNNNITTQISSCSVEKSDITLNEYLKEIKINIDNYEQSCKSYSNESLYLEIKALNQDNKTITYKIPLQLQDNC